MLYNLVLIYEQSEHVSGCTISKILITQKHHTFIVERVKGLEGPNFLIYICGWGVSYPQD